MARVGKVCIRTMVLMVTLAIAISFNAQSPSSAGISREEVIRIVDERLHHYDTILGGVSTLFTVTGVLLAIYMGIQGIRELSSWRSGRKYKTALDAKYVEIISLRDQIDNARIAERNYRIAEDYRKEDRFLDAKRYYQEAIKHYPNDQDYFFNYGKVLTEMSNFEEAQKLFRQASELFPNTTLFLPGLAECYENTGQADSALKVWQQLLDIDHNNPFYYKRVAHLYRTQANYEDALDYFEKCNRINPDMDAIKGIISVSISLYDRYKKERKSEQANHYLQKLVLTLNNLQQMNPAIFKVIFAEDIEKNGSFSDLNREQLFTDAFSIDSKGI